MSHMQSMCSETSYLFLSYQSSSVFTSSSVDVCLFGNACVYHVAMPWCLCMVLHGVVVWVVLCCID